MDGGSDASAMEAMVQAAIQGEKEWGDAMLSSGWQSTLDAVVVKTLMYDAIKEREGLQREWISRKVSRKGVWFQKEKILSEHASRYNKARNPVKTIPHLLQ